MITINGERYVILSRHGKLPVVISHGRMVDVSTQTQPLRGITRASECRGM